MSILISGSLAYDYIMDFPDSFKNHILPEQLHILNVSFVVEKLVQTLGGTAGNIAYTMKLLGAEPLVVSALGKDGGEYIEHFNQLAIATDHIIQDPAIFSAAAYITTDRDDNQINAFFPGPLASAGEIALSTITPRPELALISPTYREVMIQHLKQAKELGIKAIFDPGQQIMAFSETELKSLICQAYAVIGNDYEMKILEERTGWDGNEMLKNTEVLITTLGERGSIVTARDSEPVVVPSCPPQSCDDPTGAGDAYRAGFFTALQRGLDLQTCAEVGSVAASYAIETYGTQAHRFTTEEFEERYMRTYGRNLKW